MVDDVEGKWWMIWRGSGRWSGGGVDDNMEGEWWMGSGG